MKVILEDVEVGAVVVIAVVEGPVDYEDPDPGEEDEPEQEQPDITSLVGRVVNL